MAALLGLPVLATSTLLCGATKCDPAPAAPCNQEKCSPCYCLGPDNYGVNAAVRPRTCNGDFVIDVQGFYWNAHQDGMEYGLESHVANSSAANRRNLVDAKYLNPNFDWNFGFKLGVGYNTTCDGWDISILWTSFQGRASSHDEAEADDNHTLLPLWSAFTPPTPPLYVSNIETSWKLDLNLVDVELGREFWVSRYLTMRPFIGLRVAYLNQDYNIQYRGGSFSETTPNVNDFVSLDNNYKGAGLRSGLDTVWNLGCGWAIYGDMAFSIIYGRFDVDHDEHTREAQSPFAKTRVLETTNSFRASRFALDLGLGLQWSSLFCDCKYGFTVGLGWEHHLFMDQNQLWRVVKVGNTTNGYENVYHQRRGDLDTQGWTLSFKFDF